MDYITVASAGMAVLLGWGLSNVAIGIWRQFHPNKAKRQFWLMNGLWGAINTCIAIFALVSIMNAVATNGISAEYIQTNLNIIKINAVLDIFYVLLGLLLVKSSLNKKSVRRKMFGYAIIVQGSFLFVLDTVLVLAIA